MSEEDILLGGVIADDEQWRFPLTDSVSNKVEQCILHFEDEYFRYHFGFNPVSLSKAFVQNIKTGGIVSGASNNHHADRQNGEGHTATELFAKN